MDGRGEQRRAQLRVLAPRLAVFFSFRDNSNNPSSVTPEETMPGDVSFDSLAPLRSTTVLQP